MTLNLSGVSLYAAAAQSQGNPSKDKNFDNSTQKASKDEKAKQAQGTSKHGSTNAGATYVKGVYIGK